MLLWLAEMFRDDMGMLNVFRYLTFRVPGALATGLLITLALYPWFIRRLQFKQVGENIRHDGPESHLQKAGTPTMGGTLIILAVLTSGLLWMDLSNLWVWLTMLVMISYGILGFIDDYLKFRKKGAYAHAQSFWQFLVAVVSWVFCSLSCVRQVGSNIHWISTFLSCARIPTPSHCLRGCMWHSAVSLWWRQVGVNLTDGLDGLAIGPVVIASGTFLILCYLTNLQIAGFDVSSYLLIPKFLGFMNSPFSVQQSLGLDLGSFGTTPSSTGIHGGRGFLALGGYWAVSVFSKNEP